MVWFVNSLNFKVKVIVLDNFKNVIIPSWVLDVGKDIF